MQQDEERSRKVEAGRERLAAYRKKKREKNRNTSEESTSTSDNSLRMDQEPTSDSSNISEHIISSNESVENDRSLQEIEIFNIPGDDSRISQEDRPESLRVSDISSEPGGDRDAKHEVQSILEEILRNEQFKSDSERSVQRSNVSYSSLDQSLDIFENLNVEDASLEGYLRRQSNNSFDECRSANEKNLNAGTFLEGADDAQKKVRQLEELLAAKDCALAALTAELESVKDVASNHSTLSCPTSTEYKQCQEEYHSRIVEFQNAVTHRDDLIQQLTDSLQQSLVHREELQRQGERLATEIIELQRKLVETAELVKGHESRSEGTSQGGQLTSLSEVPGDLREFLERYIKKKLEEVEESYQKQIEEYKDKMESEQAEHAAEATKLRDLLSQIQCNANDVLELRQELETKHGKEMEELRTYFEKKCADLEKHYSEEIFSQQSRRMSGSSSCSELASDLLFSGSHPHPGGPGGDSGPSSFDVAKFEVAKRNLNGFTKKDALKLKEDLEAVSREFAKYDLEKIGKQELNTLKLDLSKFDLQSLSKYDLSNMRSELQNKYHAELEILREDYENRIDLLNVEHESRLRDIERKYGEEIETLKYDLAEALKQSGPIQEVASSGEFEITEVVQSYERRLQEQVALAKLDILASLESQIQRLAASESDDEEWPSELLQLKSRFTERYEAQIVEMEEKHQEDVARLKEEHLKILNGALERARRRSLREDSLSDVEIIKDRDNLKRVNKTLRHLIGELMKYFTKCENELNNTLIDELLKNGFDKNISQIEGDLALTDPRKVHLAPDFTDVLSILDANRSDQTDLSLDLKNELETCLEKLKADANAILAATMGAQEKESVQGVDERISSLKRQLINETHLKNDLSAQLSEAQDYVRSLESERERLEKQNELLLEKQKVMEGDLGKARSKIAELIENGHKEIVSEGYGENVSRNRRGSGDGRETFAELQERARAVISEWETEGDNPILVLLEDLCKEGDRMTEEAKKDHDDLVQQIEAADKKYKATSQFLEEQASEREQERDEAQREIEQLRDQLREREKDRASCERVNSEVQHLEQQMREMSRLIEENETRQQEIEAERQEAIEKIHVLRDIIRDLEAQVESKTESEAASRALVTELEGVIRQQNKTNAELSKRLEALGGAPDEQEFRQHIAHLEEELQRLRLSEELVGSEGALKQIRLQLFEFETSLEKRTHDLEGLHAAISSTSCSSPTEDMSIKDQIRPHTPSAAPDECDVPLQQLARLKEKLLKHSRAEDAAMKRIRDLEMQLAGMKRDFEEVQHERDALQDQVTEQLVLISSLQIRLDEQRLLAEDVQRQTNTSLEVRIYDLESEVQSLKEAVSSKEKTIKQLNNTVEQTKKRLEDREKQLRAQEEDEVVVQLRKQVQDLQTENMILENNLKSNVQSAQILPNLVDNIIADKNADIEKLRDKLSDTEKQLEMYLSLNLDRDQLKNLSMLKSSDRALGDILSLIPDQARRAPANQTESLTSVTEVPYKRAVNETSPIGGTFTSSPEISSIERVTPSMASTPVAAEKRVHFEDTEALHAEILELKNTIHVKDEVIGELSDRLKALEELQRNVEKLQRELENTEASLQKATEVFEAEQGKMREVERELRVELAEKKMRLEEKLQQVEIYGQDSARKDQMYISLAKEKRELEKELDKLRSEMGRIGEFDEVLAQKDGEIRRLEKLLAEIAEPDVKAEVSELKAELVKSQENAMALQDSVKNKTDQLKVVEEKLAGFEERISEKVETNQKLSKELENKSLQLENLNAELVTLKRSVQEKTEQLEEINKLKEALADRECEIEILNEDAKRYQDDLARLEEQLAASKKVLSSELEVHLAKARKEIAEKDLEITNLKNSTDNLDKEVAHLQELINEKDKIIHQMSEDSKSLHVNLETIQAKIQETGNIVDLARRLRDEQKRNVELQEEIHGLKATLLSQGREGEMVMSIEEITGQVRRELDYSAHLDSSILSALESGGEDAKETEALAKLKAANKELKAQQESLRKALQETQWKLEDARKHIETLQLRLEKEKLNSNEVQIEDAKLIEQMRIRLDAALDNETEFQKMLEVEKRARADLEGQVARLKRKAEAVSSSSKTELTEYKSPPAPENFEVVRLQKELGKVREENDGLRTEVKGLKRSKEESETNVKYLKDMLELKAKDVRRLEERVAAVMEAEMAVRKELFENRAVLEQKRKEVDNGRILIDEIEEDRRLLKRQLNEANERLKSVGDGDKLFSEGDQMNAPVPEKLLKKIKELKSLVKDNKQMTDALAKLNDERRILQERIIELETKNPEHVDYNEAAERANHLFGRYLRAESHRKALIWQKRYLIGLLETYQNVRPLTELLQIDGFRANGNIRTKLSGLRRFRSAVSAVIAVSRLQFITRRWHTGVRNSYHRRRKPQVPNVTILRQPSNFTHQEQPTVIVQEVPVMSSNVGGIRPANSIFGMPRPSTPANEETLPWSGSTPPSRDMGSSGPNRSGGAGVIRDSSPLAAPDLLARYIERFNQIQARLGVVLDNKPL